MIRRVLLSSLLEETTPRTVNGGHANAVQAIATTPVDDAVALGYRKGYAEGFEAGEEDGRRDAERYQQAWEQDTRLHLDEERAAVADERSRLATMVAGIEAQWQQQIVALEESSFAIALRSLAEMFGTMPSDGDVLRRLCAKLVDDYRTRALQLAVSPQDRALLPAQIEGLEVIEEAELTAGVCRLVTARGDIETSIRLRLDAIHGAMLDVIGAGQV